MTLIRELIDIPTQVRDGDFVLKLTEGVGDDAAAATIASYEVTPQLAQAFDEALGKIAGAISSGSSEALYPHGSFGAGKAFYPSMPFRAGTTEDQRQLRVRRAARSVLDRAIRTAADSGWAFLELPHRVAPPTDREAIEIVAALVTRLLTADIEVHDHVRPPASAPLAAHRIAVGAAHRSQRAAIRLAVDRHNRSAGVDATEVVVDTANRLQGREYDVVVVLHPLSGRAAASEFHLEAGRLCVLLSRHRQACIVVGRAGIADVLDAHPGAMPVWLGARIAVPDGWEANQVVLERLQVVKVPIGSAAR